MFCYPFFAIRAREILVLEKEARLRHSLGEGFAISRRRYWGSWGEEVRLPPMFWVKASPSVGLDIGDSLRFYSWNAHGGVG